MFKTLGQLIKMMFTKTLSKILFQKHVTLLLKTAFTRETYTQGINSCSAIVRVKFMKTSSKLLLKKTSNISYFI